MSQKFRRAEGILGGVEVDLSFQEDGKGSIRIVKHTGFLESGWVGALGMRFVDEQAALDYLKLKGYAPA